MEEKRWRKATKGGREEVIRKRRKVEGDRLIYCPPPPTAMVQRDLPGYAIGGLSGGEEKDVFWKIVSLCTDLLPRHKPRYLMGVG